MVLDVRIDITQLRYINQFHDKKKSYWCLRGDGVGAFTEKVKRNKKNVSKSLTENTTSFRILKIGYQRTKENTSNRV